MFKDCSNIALDVLNGHELFTLAYRSLNEGHMVYPDRTRFFMHEGQLMGHPLSFPLLCVINLAVFRCALERWCESDRRNFVRARRMYHNVIINGDDILFKAPRVFLPFFYSASADAGFQISQGKNYVSRDCCLINSQLYKRKSGIMTRFGYLNLRLVKGTSLKSGDSAATPDQLGRELGKMAALCPWTASCIPAALNRFSPNFKGWFQPNWYLPVHLGGYGVPIELAPPSLHFTRSQREIASRFVSDPRMALYRRKGFSIPLADFAGSLANWRMVPGLYVPEASESRVDELDDDWLARIAYAFRASNGPWDHDKDALFISHYRPEFRLKPMSLDGLLAYWSAQLFATRLPVCPPIQNLRVTPFDVDRYPVLEEGLRYDFIDQEYKLWSVRIRKAWLIERQRRTLEWFSVQPIPILLSPHKPGAGLSLAAFVGYSKLSSKVKNGWLKPESLDSFQEFVWDNRQLWQSGLPEEIKSRLPPL
jgi:hypothetical protein